MPNKLHTALKLNTALQKIGVSNGHKPPESQDPMDAVMHEYLVSTVSASYFEKRRKAAKEDIEKKMSDVAKAKITEMHSIVTDIGTMQRATLAIGQAYTLNASVKSSGYQIDEKLLRVALLKKFPADEVEEIISNSRKARALALTYEVTENDG